MATDGSGSGVKPSDLMSLQEAMKAAMLMNVLGGLPGMDLFRLGGLGQVEQARALGAIPTRRSGFAQNELGFSPGGPNINFTGGSPHEQDFTGQRVQNVIFLLDQLVRSGILGKKKPQSNIAGTSIDRNAGPANYGGIDLLKGLR
jgi:hypothetical protein